MENDYADTETHRSNELSDYALVDSAITDNAKRSVSIRINTSDYGRIKTIAKRLKVRESTVFRYLLRNGLKSVAPLYQGKLRFREFIEMFFQQPEIFIEHFNLDKKRIGGLVNGITEHLIDDDDLEMLCLINQPHRYLAERLSTQLHREVAPEHSIADLKSYLIDKYTAQ